MKKISSKLKENLFLYGLLFFGFVLRLFYIFIFTKPESYLWSDPGGYDQRALLLAKDQYVMFSTYWPPFFHLFLSIIYRPLVWLGLESQRIKIDIVLFALLYIIGFWCIYYIVKKLFSEKTALIVLVILIFWYPFIFLNYLIMSENLFFPLAFLGLYFLIVKPQKPSTGLWLGLFWGLALLTRPIFALVLPLFILWGIYYKLNWRLLLNFAIAIFIIIGLMATFNFFYTKGVEKSISSNGGVGFALLWCDAKSIEFNNNGYSFGFAPPANVDYSDSKRIFTSVPFENQKHYYQMGINCISNNPERLFTNTSSIIKLFHSHLFPTTANVAFWEGFRLFFKFLAGFLFILSLATIIGIKTNLITLEQSTKKYFYLMFFIVLSVILTVYLQNPGEERYLIPYAPLLIILCIPFFNLLPKLEQFFKLFLTNKNKIFTIPFLILFLGIIIRLFYVYNFGFENYTHDLPAHMQYIQYVAQNLFLPDVSKGLEFPQQPLYYLITGIIYRLLSFFNNLNILKILVYFSTLFSIGTLISTYFFAKKFTNLLWLQAFVIGIIAFTPAFVFQAGMIGNDPFLTFLSSTAFLFLIYYIKEEKIKYLVLTIFFSILAVFTKITGGILLIMVLFALIYKYKAHGKKIILPAIIVCLLGFFCLFAIFYRAYIPSTKQFRFVESYVYQGQEIYPSNLSYFLSFKTSDLLSKQDLDYSMYGNKNISQSLNSFLYRSFLFGEYQYYNIINLLPDIRGLMQLITLFGFIFPASIIINLFFIKKWDAIDYVSVFGLIINLALIISFIFSYPSVCNSDFRYFAPSFLALVSLSAMGLSRLNQTLKIKFIIPVLCSIFIFYEFIFISARITIKILTNI